MASQGGSAMKYAVWFVRLIFAAWMIPAGVNHFIRLFPQPMGTQPLSHELIVALLDSHLFDLVKLVELIAGIGVLTGFQLPLTLVLCMPVSFCVWYWDTPLEGWGSGASYFGSAVLICNVLLCLAYIRNYASMFTLRPRPRAPGAAPSARYLVLAAQVIFGAWMLVNGLNHFFLSLYPLPTGSEPLAVQLMTALVHSRLIDVAMAIQLVGGALILAGLFVPLALCVVMPVSVCAAYWAVILEHQPLGALLALIAVALNGFLMLAYIGYYKGVLERRALTVGETAENNGSFDSVYATIGGSTDRGPYIGALITLIAAYVFYYVLVQSRTGLWCELMLLFPAVVLLARRLRDMEKSPWLLILPVALLIVTFWFKLDKAVSTTETAVTVAAVVVSVGFMLWGLIGKGQITARQFGKAAE